MHQNVDKSIQEDHRLSNATELCDIFEKCGKVKKVFQGHYHPGKCSLHNGIEYVTLPAMCTENEGYFIFELY